MFKILIDPGHGKNDNKGVDPAYKEGTQMWKLSQKILQLLSDYDCEAVTTRPSINDNPLPEDRGKMAKGYDAFLSLHSNTPGSDAKGTPAYEKCTGTISFYSIARPNDKPFAKDLVEGTAKLMGIYSRGAETKTKKNGDDWYAVIRNAIAVGCKHAFIIEHGFHSNKHDCAWLLDDTNLDKLAQFEVSLFEKYYSIKKKVTPAPAPTPASDIEAGDLVSIQSGATYTNGKKVPSKYLAYNWYVTKVNTKSAYAILGKSEDGKHSLDSAIALSYLTKVVKEYYTVPLYSGSSITEALAKIGVDNSYTNRAKIAQFNGIKLYVGTSAQNKRLLELLKKGELLKP